MRGRVSTPHVAPIKTAPRIPQSTTHKCLKKYEDRKAAGHHPNQRRQQRQATPAARQQTRFIPNNHNTQQRGQLEPTLGTRRRESLRRRRPTRTTLPIKKGEKTKQEEQQTPKLTPRHNQRKTRDRPTKNVTRAGPGPVGILVDHAIAVFQTRAPSKGGNKRQVQEGWMVSRNNQRTQNKGTCIDTSKTTADVGSQTVTEK